MWLLLVITDNNVSQIITFVSYLINFTTNIFGIFIWIKLKKKQGEKKRWNFLHQRETLKNS